MIRLFTLPKFYHAVAEHRQVEKEIHRLLHHNLPATCIADQAPSLGFLKYAQKNFFSTLFLSIYQALNIPKERRLFYGQINHCLRGLVTGTDNLLDNEYKEMLPLAFPDTAVRFKSVMHLLLFDRFLVQIIEQAAQNNLVARDDVSVIHRKLFAALVLIGAEEALEEGGIKEILLPEEILSSVHMYKGGKLLCLAFVAPLHLERESAAALGSAEQGIYSIGMALQIVDDLTDFYEDLRNQNHNYLVSSIYHQGTDDEKEDLALLLADRNIERGPIELIFVHSTRRVMRQAIGEAIHGFDRLHDIGFWLDRGSAYKLIRFLFQLRGVENLLPLFPRQDELESVPAAGRQQDRYVMLDRPMQPSAVI